MTRMVVALGFEPRTCRLSTEYPYGTAYKAAALPLSYATSLLEISEVFGGEQSK